VLFVGLSAAAAVIFKAALDTTGSAIRVEETSTASDSPAAQPAAGKPLKKKGSGPQDYHRLLFDTLAAPLTSEAAAGHSRAAASQAVLQGMPWLLNTFCTSLHSLCRQAAVQGSRHAMVQS
jgi:hypothetical protein